MVRFTWSAALPNSAYLHPRASHCSWAQVTFLPAPRKTWPWPQPGLRVCCLSSLSSSFSLPLVCPVPSFHRAVPMSLLLPGRPFPFFFLSYLLVILSSEATFLSRSDVLMLSSPGPMYFSSLETTAVVFLRVCNLMTCSPPHTSSFCFLYPAQCLSSSNTHQYLWNHWIFCRVDLLLDHGGQKHASLHAEGRNVQWGCLSSLCVSWDPCLLFGTYSIRLKSQTFLLDSWQPLIHSWQPRTKLRSLL